MALPPISGSNRSDFVNPYTAIESVVANLENCLSGLVSKINAVVALANKEPDTQDLLQIAKLIHSIEQCSIDADKSIGNPQTIMSIKKYIQELFDVLSTRGASIVTAVKEDTKENSSTHLKSTLETFAKLPHASKLLTQELDLIAGDIHLLQIPRPRHIG